MGLFGDAFNISAGATLGNLAVKTGYQAAEEFLNATEKTLIIKCVQGALTLLLDRT